MQEYPIYNLEANQQEFEICGYKFVKVDNYEKKIKSLHRLSTSSFSLSSGKWEKTIEAKAGKHQHTFTAFWDNEVSSEPIAKLHLDSTLIYDILLLYSIWGNRNVCTGKDFSYKQHPYYNENSFISDYHLHCAIETALKSIVDKADAKRKKVFPSLFLLHESNLIREWQIKLSILSTAIDIISKSTSCKIQDSFSNEEINSIATLKEKIANLISETEDTFSSNIRENVLSPFKYNIDKMGSVSTIDHLIKWTATVLEINKEEKELQIALHDHCIAFNKFRNSVIHFAGLPKSNIDIRLTKNSTIKVSQKIDEKSCGIIGAYYYYVFKDILFVWFAKTIEIESIPSKKSTSQIRDFLQTGKWCGQFIFEGHSKILNK